jgi:hypothetical protein
VVRVGLFASGYGPGASFWGLYKVTLGLKMGAMIIPEQMGKVGLIPVKLFLMPSHDHMLSSPRVYARPSYQRGEIITTYLNCL